MPAAPPLKPIKRTNLYEDVIEHLKEYIIVNRLQPGDRLPTEMVLAESLEVSRLSVREGLKVLESLGVVQSRPRDGTRLKAVSIEPAVNHLRFMFDVQHVPLRDIGAARQMIECAMMPNIVARATAEDFESLRQAIEALEAAAEADDLAGVVEADSLFHRTLLAANRNQALEGFGGMLQQFFHSLSPEGAMVDARRQTAEEHRSIYEALLAGDADRAAALMREHLQPYAER